MSAQEEVGELVSVRASEVQPSRISWLWRDKFACSMINLIAGLPGTSKSMFASAFMAATVSTGRNWPDGSPCQRGQVLIIQAEDGIEDTLTPRLVAAGADLTKIHIVQHKVDRDGRESGFKFEDHKALYKKLRGLGDVRMVVIDPVGSFCGRDADTNKDSDVRDLLRALTPIAHEFKCAFVLVAHFNKGGTGKSSSITRVMGSMAFVGLARCAWATIRDSEQDKNLRLLVPIKANIAADTVGIKYKVQSAPSFTHRGVELHDIGQIVYCGVHDETADAALDRQNASKPGPAPERAKNAEQFLRDFLSSGRQAAAAIIAASKAAGISRSTLYRAKDALNVRVGGQAPYFWSLVPN